MALKNVINKTEPLTQGDRTILAIDPSSNSLAFAVAECRNGKQHLIGAGEIEFPKKANTIEKLAIVGSALPTIIDSFKPTEAMVEKTVYLQNPQTTVLLAYFVGHIMGTIIGKGIPVEDIPPMSWKPKIGYKNVTKKEMDTWGLDAKETKKKAAFERKERTKRIIRERIPLVNEYNDNIFDAIAIAIYTLENR